MTKDGQARHSDKTEGRLLKNELPVQFKIKSTRTLMIFIPNGSARHAN